MPIRDLVPWKRDEESVPVKREEEGTLATWQREMNRLFDDFFGLRPFEATEERPWATFSPRVDLFESDKEVKVTAELPGMDEEDIDVTLAHNVLSISGEKREQKEREEESYYYMERSYGTFRRSISLPSEVNADKVDAVFKNGVLTITLPKTAEARRATKISVQAR